MYIKGDFVNMRALTDDVAELMTSHLITFSYDRLLLRSRLDSSLPSIEEIEAEFSWDLEDEV